MTRSINGARLADDVCRRGVLVSDKPGEFRHPKGAEKLLQGLVKQIPRFILDETTELFFAGNPKEHWNIWEDFPALDPPFPEFWVETYAPSRIVSEEFGTRAWSGPPRWGLHCQFEEWAKGTFNRESGIRWTAALTAVVSGRGLAALLGHVQLPISEQGTVPRHATESPPGSGQIVLPGVGALAVAAGASGLLSLAKPLLYGLCFINAQNVPREERIVASRWDIETKRVPRPALTYHVLSLTGLLSKTVGKANPGEMSEAKKALHLCRGHFKTYTDDRPLFGKRTGTFFWHGHARGSATAGVVDKDYRATVPA